MPDQLLPNNPYARPVHATRPEGQMLVGEYYGERSKDKTLAGLNGRQVSPASRYASKAIAVPVDMDAPPAPEPKKARKPKPVLTVPPAEQLEPTGIVTEDDLFG